MKKTAIYVRVSTDEQVTGFSIDMQRERLKAFCLSQGWEDVEEFIDDGYSGTNTNRPALKSLLQKIKRDAIDCVVVYKLDRLGRKQKDVLYLLEDVFEKNNVAFKSATEPFDTSTPLGKAMLGILAVFGQLERDMIIERTTSGRRQRIKEGLWSGGRVPFGYTWDKVTRKFEINESEAWIVRDIFTRFAKGEKNLAIAEWASKVAPYHTFDHSVIRDMMSRKVYIGILQNGDQEAKGLHEPLISEELWDKVQKEMVKRKGTRQPNGDFMLSGLLKCELCGETVQHVKSKTKANGKVYEYSFYACRNQHVRAKDKKVHCKLGYFKREVLEGFIENEMQKAFFSPKEVISIIEVNSNKSINELDKKTLLKRIEKINVGIENLYDAIQIGSIKASAVTERLKKLETEREQIYTQLDEFETDTSMSSHEIYNLIKDMKEAWPILSDTEKREVMSLIIEKVIIRKDGNHTVVWSV